LPFQAIETWYRGNKNTNTNNKDIQDDTLPNFTQSWNLLRVVQHKMIKEINAQIPDKPGSRAYLGQFRRVSGTISKNLSLAVKREYLALADEWNHQKPPEEVQKRFAGFSLLLMKLTHVFRQAKKFIAQTTAKFADEIHRQMGAKALIMLTWVGENNEVNTNLYVATISAYHN
jgi:hypothetical protein